MTSIEQEYQTFLDTLTEKEAADNAHPERVQRVIPIHIDKEHPLYATILEPTGHAATNLYNYANYRVRNIFTGLHKSPEQRYPNETDSISWANAALNRYKKNRTDTLNKKISKLEKANNDPKRDEKLKDCRDELSRVRKMTALVDEERSFVNYNLLDCIFHYHAENTYIALPSAVAQEVLREVGRAWKGYFNSIKSYKNNPGAFCGRPALPSKRTPGSISTYTYSQRGWSMHLDEDSNKNYFTVAGSKERVPIGDVLTRKDNYDNLKIQTLECVPAPDGFDLYISYSCESRSLVAFNDRVAGIDFGVDNLITLVSNAGDTHPLIVDGRFIKSANQYFNKKNAQVSARYRGCFTSNEKKALWRKRDAQIDNLLGQAANRVRDWLMANDISLLVVGYNKGWKADGGLEKWDKAVKQNFVHIPFARLLSKLRDKCAEIGVRCVVTEESYTSKASLVDGDFLPSYGDVVPDGGYKFSGRRKSRGLYQSRVTMIGGRGVLLNADVNGAGNILRKVCPSAFDGVVDWRFLMCPERVRLGYELGVVRV